MKKKIKIIIIIAALMLTCTTISSVSAADGDINAYGVPLKSTFNGGNSADNMTINGNKMAVDNNGSVYIVGYTNSPNLPTTPGAYQTTLSSPSSSNTDVFITKYSNDQSQLLACTYLGGLGNDFGNSIAIGNNGNVYVTGYTDSLSGLTSPGGFPVATGAFDTTKGGTKEAFVAMFDPSLSQLLACTFLGGGGDDYGNDITIDDDDNIYVTGKTDSTDFAAAFSDEYGTGYQNTPGPGFVVKLDPMLSTLSAGTYFNGTSYAIAMGDDGSVYITGRTSLSTGFATDGAYDTSRGGQNDAFIARLNSSLNQLFACTYFGGSGSNDDAYDIVVGNDNNVYITGISNSNDLPTTTGAYDNTRGGSSDAYIAKLNSSLSELLACTYFGGSTIETGYNIVVGSDGSIYVTGITNSNDLPTTTGAYDNTYNGGQDAFIACFNNSLSTLNYSTYYGGSGDDYGYALTFTGQDAFAMGGYTSSADLPVNGMLIGNPVDNSSNGGTDLFMSLWFFGSEFKVPAAQFTADMTSREAPLTAHFTDKSSNFPTSWSWDFNNDGKIDSTQQNPVWVYNTPGTYTVKLTVSNSAGSDEELKTSYITVYQPVAPTADFKAIKTAAGVTTTVTVYKVNDTVQFTDISSHYPTSWSWDFNNDGKIDSTQQNPTWNYTTPGTYTVKLNVSNAMGSNTITKTGYITIASKLNIYSTSENNTNPGAPDAGIPGFVGPDGDGILGTNNYVNPIFKEWASSVINWTPANQDIQEQWTNVLKALGPVTNDNFDIVSLGDLSLKQLQDGELPGSIILGFNTAIANGDGPDFAIFENGFISLGGAGVAGETFAELGYVEVSTDGIHFIRFPSISLTPGLVGGYGTIDPTNVYNLAGKHCNAYGYSWGTPFDLQDLINMPEVQNGIVDLNNINYVKIIDIPGCGFLRDSQGRPIYDAWVTWGSGGLDLEAIGVIHTADEIPPIDSIAPVVTSIDPANNKVINVANKALVITFSENIKAGSAFTSIKVTNPDGVKVKPLYKVINGKTLTLTRNGNYINGLTYTITLPTGSITDTAGNPITAFTSKFKIDTTRPKITNTNPKNRATKVARNKTIKITFNENIKASKTYWIELVASNGSKITIKKSIKGKVLTLTHTTKLKANTKYKLTIHTGAITDTAGNPLAAKTITFTTGNT